MKKKRPGPKPKRISLYPLKFDEAVDILIKAKPKKQNDKKEVDAEEDKGATQK